MLPRQSNKTSSATLWLFRIQHFDIVVIVVIIGIIIFVVSCTFWKVTTPLGWRLDAATKCCFYCQQQKQKCAYPQCCCGRKNRWKQKAKFGKQSDGRQQLQQLNNCKHLWHSTCTWKRTHTHAYIWWRINQLIRQPVCTDRPVCRQTYSVALALVATVHSKCYVIYGC